MKEVGNNMPSLKNAYLVSVFGIVLSVEIARLETLNQRTNGPVNAHLISWPSKAQNIQNLENIW